MALNIDRLQENFYISIKDALDRFAITKHNHEIYALVFDCDSSVGQICLRYANMTHFNKSLKQYKEYKYMFEPYGKYGLRGYKYAVGDFPMLDFEYSPLLNQFLDSYYYFETGDYFGQDKPMIELRSSYKEIWQEMILSCIKKIQKEYTILQTTDDFIIYMRDHDQSKEKNDPVLTIKACKWES